MKSLYTQGMVIAVTNILAQFTFISLCGQAIYLLSDERITHKIVPFINNTIQMIAYHSQENT